MLKKQQRINTANRRLLRDLKEWQANKIPSIGAEPLNDNLFEWHVNLKHDGVYSSVCVHLIMLFGDNYPSEPPQIRICTPIRHPNVFGDFLCLSMLRPETLQTPYEGWSATYSVTSILMQLSSFLFAEEIEQDGAYLVQARLHNNDVEESLEICRQFHCTGCGHTHQDPFPKIYDLPTSSVSLLPLDRTHDVLVHGTAAQTTSTQWISCKGSLGVFSGNVMYEAFVNWSGDRWSPSNTGGGLCRFGWGTTNASQVGTDNESVGYGGTAKLSFCNQFTSYGEEFGKGDYITCAVDFQNRRFLFAKNGRLLLPCQTIPANLRGKALYPMLSFKNSRVEFNFGNPKRPVPELKEFWSLEDIHEYTTNKKKDDLESKSKEQGIHNFKFDVNTKIIDEIFVMIFEYLQVPEMYHMSKVCQRWHTIMFEYNIFERNELVCFYTKDTLSNPATIFGVGFERTVEHNGRKKFKSQMDIISLHAWENEKVRTGIWGETLTHFLPLVINKQHGQNISEIVEKYLKHLWYGSLNTNDNEWDKTCMLECLAEIMNCMVVEFVMGNSESSTNSNIMGNIPSIRMQFCEKILLGYVSLYHMLLWLAYRIPEIKEIANKKVDLFLKDPKYRLKSSTPDLGKFLVYVLISDFDWRLVGKEVMLEVLTRNSWWIIKKYRFLNTCIALSQRLIKSLEATVISRRLVMFQVWFMTHANEWKEYDQHTIENEKIKNNSNNVLLNTLNSFNRRLGRPSLRLKRELKRTCDYILGEGSQDWNQYFVFCGFQKMSEKDIHLLLEYAMKCSALCRYHTINDGSERRTILPPQLLYRNGKPGITHDQLEINNRKRTRREMNNEFEDNYESQIHQQSRHRRRYNHEY